MKWAKTSKIKWYLYGCFSILLLLALGFSACVQNESLSPSRTEANAPILSPSQGEITESNSGSTESGAQTDALAITLTVNGKAFEARLENTVTAEAFLECLPLEIEVKELNGNEKYFYLDHPLPTDSSQPGNVKAGELMLYGDNCLVLFYESFDTSYSYTPIGTFNNPAGLKNALGPGSADITITRK